MKAFGWILLLSLLGLSCHSSDYDQALAKFEEKSQQGRPLLKVGDQVIYEGYFQILRETMPAFAMNFSNPEGRRKILDGIIAQELFLAKSKELDLINKSSRLQRELWLNARALIGVEYLHQEADRRAREKYDQEIDEYYSRIEIADIVFLFKNTGAKDRSEQQRIALQKARELRKKLTVENFSEIAAQYSEHPLTKKVGGVLGAISMIDRRVQALGWRPLVERALQMKKSEISEPLVTKEGVHLILALEDKQTQSYQEVGPYLRQEILLQVKQELLQNMLAETKVEYLEPGLLPPTPSPDGTVSATP